MQGRMHPQHRAVGHHDRLRRAARPRGPDERRQVVGTHPAGCLLQRAGMPPALPVAELDHLVPSGHPGIAGRGVGRDDVLEPRYCEHPLQGAGALDHRNPRPAVARLDADLVHGERRIQAHGRRPQMHDRLVGDELRGVVAVRHQEHEVPAPEAEAPEGCEQIPDMPLESSPRPALPAVGTVAPPALRAPPPHRRIVSVPADGLGQGPDQRPPGDRALDPGSLGSDLIPIPAAHERPRRPSNPDSAHRSKRKYRRVRLMKQNWTNASSGWCAATTSRRGWTGGGLPRRAAGVR